MIPHRRFDCNTREQLEARAAELGARLPYAAGVDLLLERLALAGRTLTNRIVVQPMEGCDAHSDGSPSALTHRRYERYARGGSGLIWFEATAVRAEARSNPRQLVLSPQTAAAFRTLLRGIRATAESPGGAPLLILQMTHPGRFTRAAGRRQPILAHHCPPLEADEDWPLISDGELDRLQEEYVALARLAAEVGFDGVDLKACHGYLVSELLAAFTRPASRYGGGFENRTRFLRETLAGIASAAPDLILACRLNVWDTLPHPHGFGADPGGSDEPALDEPLELARRLPVWGASLLNVTLGIPYHRPHFGRPFDQPHRGGAPAPEDPLAGVARLITLASTVQQAAGAVPVVGTGYSWLRHHAPHVGAGVVAAGGAALFGIGRLAFAYPDLPRDLAMNGRADPRKVCTTCSGCTQLMHAGEAAGCVVRDSTEYLPRYRRAMGRE